MIEAARKKKRKYDVVKKMGKGNRRLVHDDITVVVVFIDQQVNTVVDEVSIRGFSSSTVPSDFSSLQGVEENAPTGPSDFSSSQGVEENAPTGPSDFSSS